MILPLSLCAESSVPQEEAQAESQLPLMIAQVQPESNAEEKVKDDADVLDDLEDLEEGEQAVRRGVGQHCRSPATVEPYVVPFQ